MNDDVPLLKLPDVAMNRVLRHCEYPDFVSLRKTCRSLREFVDTAKPDGRVDKVWINCNVNEVIFRLKMGEKVINVEYNNEKGGCFHRHKSGSYTSSVLKGMDFMEMFKNDFSVFLGHQKSLLQDMTINGKTAEIEQAFNVLKAHAENIKTRSLPLKTTKLWLSGLPASQVLLALSSVDVQSLRFLSISIREQSALLDEITETEQWRHLTECSISGIRISDVRRISHLNTFRGHVTMVSAADLDHLKTVFINSSTFFHCKMNCNTVADLSEITETFGVQPYISRGSFNGVYNRWFFRIPNDKSRVLSLNVNSVNIIDIGRIVTARVPNDAVIIG